MNKCPHCGAPLGALVKFCEACGSEVTAQASPVAGGNPESTRNAPSSAAELCETLQSDLGVLRSRGVPSKVANFIVGFITPVTLGLAFICYKALGVFGRSGQSDNRLVLAVNQNILKASSGYAADPSVAKLIREAKEGLELHAKRRHSARLAFFLGLGSCVLLGAVVAVAGSVLAARKISHEKAAFTQAVQALHQGKIQDVIASFSELPPQTQEAYVAKDPLFKIAQAVMNGRKSEALDLCAGIPDEQARQQLENQLGLDLFEEYLAKSDWDNAKLLANRLSPASARLEALDQIWERQAVHAIEANQMDVAEKLIANINDSGLKTRLEGMIAARQPKVDLGGF